MSKLLLVDDQEHILEALELLFEMRGIPTCRAKTPSAALAAIRAGDVSCVMQDMNFSRATTSGEEGVALFNGIRALDPEMPVLVMTAWASLETAVALVKLGADDYLEKPWNDEQLVRKVENALRARAMCARGDRSLGAKPDTQPNLCGMVFKSVRTGAVVKLAIKVARSDASVLVSGPNGTGKEMLAEIVHANSDRSDRPFIKVNAGAIPDELFSAELFGAEAGAFTGAKGRRVGRFEAADGGTLFLDEIGNLSLSSQAKLLRALQSGEFERLGSNETRRADVRVVAASNIDMKQAITEGVFREDLYYRLAVIELAMPPLAQRLEDIPALSEAFIRQYAQASGLESPPSLSQAAHDAMAAHAWHGNVRELQNCIRRGLLTCEGECLTPTDLGLDGHGEAPPDRVAASHAGGGHLPANDSPTPTEIGTHSFDEAERDTVAQALREANQVVTVAAKRLGVSRQALYRRMQRLGMNLKKSQ